jgi:hypothetical protein
MEQTNVSPENEAAVSEAAVMPSFGDVVVDPQSLLKSELRMLVSASPCPLCGDRPRLTRSNQNTLVSLLFPDSPGMLYFVGCLHYEVNARLIQEAFALWEEKLPDWAMLYDQELTRLRPKLHSKMLINAKLTATDWGLLRPSTQAAKTVAKALNKMLNEVVNEKRSVNEVLETMLATMQIYQRVGNKCIGTTDTEPRAVLRTLLELIFPDSMRRTKAHLNDSGTA